MFKEKPDDMPEQIKKLFGDFSGPPEETEEQKKDKWLRDKYPGLFPTFKK